jgi:hypothetical protein
VVAKCVEGHVTLSIVVDAAQMINKWEGARKEIGKET